MPPKAKRRKPVNFIDEARKHLSKSEADSLSKALSHLLDATELKPKKDGIINKLKAIKESVSTALTPKVVGSPLIPKDQATAGLIIIICDILLQPEAEELYLKLFSWLQKNFQHLETESISKVWEILKPIYNQKPQEQLKQISDLWRIILMTQEELSLELIMQGISWLTQQAFLEEALSTKLFTLAVSENSQNEEKLRAICIVAQYLLNITRNAERAKQCFEKVFEPAEISISKFRDYYTGYRDLLSDEEAKQAFNVRCTAAQPADEGRRDFTEAKRLLAFCQDIKDAGKLQEGIHQLKKSALSEYKEAMAHLSLLEMAGKEPDLKKLSVFEQRKILYAVLAKQEVLSHKGGYKAKSKAVEDSYFYSPKDYLEQLAKKARTIYDHLIKHPDPIACYEVAMMRKTGTELFPKNLYVSRSLFLKASDAGHLPSLLELAELCFNGEGGSIDLILAETLLATYLKAFPEEARALYLLGEIKYFHFLHLEKQDPKVTDKHYQESICLFERAVKQDHEKARLSLEIAEEYRSSSKDRAPDEGIMHVDEPETAGEPSGTHHTSGASVDAPEEDLSECSDTQRLRHIVENNSSKAPQAKERLLEIYRQKQHGILILISTLCYEAQRHVWDSPVCAVLRRLLTEIEPSLAGDDQLKLRVYLTEQEKQLNDYFDEDISEDSDAEREVAYKAASHSTTAPHEYAHDLIQRIKPKTLKKLEEIEKIQADLSEEQYATQLSTLASLYSDVEYFSKPKKTSADKATIERDLNILNFYVAQGRPEEAMSLMSTRFGIVQLRGLHFNTRDWNQPMRRKLRKLTKNPTHPLHNQPVFCRAAYEHAGVTDFFDFSDKTTLKLEKSARLIQLRLLDFFEKSPKQPLPSKVSSAATALYGRDTVRAGLQQLYSTDYTAVHSYFDYASQRPERFFVNSKNPFVSTGDLPSVHPARYAYGQKMYQGHENERLRPRWDQKKQAHRPHSGMIYLTVHPVSDLFHRSHQHVLSMNMQGELIVNEHINPERETTFLGQVRAQRVKYTHAAKFPSFTLHDGSERHINFFMHTYGLDQELYTKFSENLFSSSPHSIKRRLTVHVLGEYLSAYATLFLTRLAFEKAQKDGYILIFRTALGTFSLKPHYDISPTPHGDEEYKRLRRQKTAELRKLHKRGPATQEESEDEYVEEDEPLDPEQKRVRLENEDELMDEAIPSEAGMFSSSGGTSSGTQSSLGATQLRLGVSQDD